MDFAERRKHPRVALSVDVDITSEHNFYAGRTRDISLGGLFIETELGLPVGSQISVRLQLQNQQFTAQAEVCWQLLKENGEPEGVGVRFVKVRPLMRKAIEEFMALRAPMEYEEAEAEPEEAEPAPKRRAGKKAAAPGPAKKGPPPLPGK